VSAARAPPGTARTSPARHRKSTVIITIPNKTTIMSSHLRRVVDLPRQEHRAIVRRLGDVAGRTEQAPYNYNHLSWLPTQTISVSSIHHPTIINTPDAHRAPGLLLEGVDPCEHGCAVLVVRGRRLLGLEEGVPGLRQPTQFQQRHALAVVALGPGCIQLSEEKWGGREGGVRQYSISSFHPGDPYRPCFSSFP
jgi:hypothetical protein